MGRAWIALLLLGAMGAASADIPWEAMVDSFETQTPRLMERAHIAGLLIAVVGPDDRQYLGAWGWADVTDRVPADAAASLFRVGSVSKVFTATAVMRCVDRGLIDLDADVNTYLRTFQVPPAFSEPVTVGHLLTHTAGFDDKFLHIGVPFPHWLEPLGPYLREHLPPRVMPPGEVFNYSNFGIVLAAHAVECVTGMPFGAYMDAEVFEPLGIEPGGFAQPLPPRLRSRLAAAYDWEGGRHAPAPMAGAASQVWPAGALAISAPGLGRFMRAHLEYDPRLMGAESYAAMHRLQFKNHPALVQGHALGFHRRIAKGHVLLWHTGRVNRFTGQLVLVPGLGLGLAAAANTSTGDAIREDLVALLLRHMPEGGTAPPVLKEQPAGVDTASMQGAYIQVRRPRSDCTKLALFGRETVFQPNGAGGLVQRGAFTRAPDAHWQPRVSAEGDAVFELPGADPPRRLVFKKDTQGRFHYACLDQAGYSVLTTYERLPWYGRSLFQGVLGLAGLLVLLSLLARSWLRRCSRAPRADSAAGHLLDRLMAVLASLFLIFIAGLGLTLALIEPYRFVFGIPFPLAVLRVVPLLASAAALSHALALAAALPGKPGLWGHRAHHLAGQCAAWLLLWQCAWWNLAGL